MDIRKELEELFVYAREGAILNTLGAIPISTSKEDTNKAITLFNQWLEEQGAEVETRNPNWAQVRYSDKFIHVPLRII